MRITEQMFKFDSQNGVNDAEKATIDIQNKLSSGLEVNKPSDDPLRFVTAARFKSIVNSKEQFLRNISDSRRFLDDNDATLSNVTQLLQRTRVLLIQSSNDTYVTADLKLTAKELRQSLEGLVKLANSSDANGKVFGGAKTTTDPFEVVRDATGTITNVIYRGNTVAASRQISESSQVDVNFVGSRLFQIDPATQQSSFAAPFAGQTLAASVPPFPAGDTTGFFTLQGSRVFFDTANDSLLSIRDRINSKAPAITATVTGSLVGTATFASAAAATAATAGTVLINGTSIAIAAGASLNAVVSAVNGVTGQTGVTASAQAVAGGFALSLSGGVRIDDTTPLPASNAFQVFGATSSASPPANLTSRNPLAYRLSLATTTPDQIIGDDEGSGRFLERLGVTDGTANAPANSGTGTATNVSLFKTFIDAITNLEAGQVSQIRTNRIAEMDRGLASISKASGDLGGLVQRVENAQSREESFIIQAKSVISANEDLDVAKAISDLRQAQLKLDTAIGAAQNVPIRNLLQFL